MELLAVNPGIFISRNGFTPIDGGGGGRRWRFVSVILTAPPRAAHPTVGCISAAEELASHLSSSSEAHRTVREAA